MVRILVVVALAIIVALVGASIMNEGGSYVPLGLFLVLVGIGGITKLTLDVVAGRPVVLPRIEKPIWLSRGRPSGKSSSPRRPAFSESELFRRISNMSTFGQWVTGAILAIVAVFALFLLSRAEDNGFGMFAFLLFLFGVGGCAVVVHVATDYSAAGKAPQAGEGGETQSS